MVQSVRGKAVVCGVGSLLAVGLVACPAFVSDDYEFVDARGGVAGDCAANETVSGGHCYFVTSSLDDFDAAQEACESRGATWGLVEIGSQEEHDLVVELADGEEAWLGATDRDSEGDWSWNSGAPLWEGDEGGTCLGDFCEWDATEPNSLGDCARLDDDVWRDTPCIEPHIAVCESG